MQETEHAPHNNSWKDLAGPRLKYDVAKIIDKTVYFTLVDGTGRVFEAECDRSQLADQIVEEGDSGICLFSNEGGGPILLQKDPPPTITNEEWERRVAERRAAFEAKD